MLSLRKRKGKIPQGRTEGKVGCKWAGGSQMGQVGEGGHQSQIVRQVGKAPDETSCNFKAGNCQVKLGQRQRQM